MSVRSNVLSQRGHRHARSRYVPLIEPARNCVPPKVENNHRSFSALSLPNKSLTNYRKESTIIVCRESTTLQLALWRPTSELILPASCRQQHIRTSTRLEGAANSLTLIAYWSAALGQGGLQVTTLPFIGPINRARFPSIFEKRVFGGGKRGASDLHITSLPMPSVSQQMRKYLHGPEIRHPPSSPGIFSPWTECRMEPLG